MEIPGYPCGKFRDPVNNGKKFRKFCCRPCEALWLEELQVNSKSFYEKFRGFMESSETTRERFENFCEKLRALLWNVQSLEISEPITHCFLTSRQTWLQHFAQMDHQ